MDPGLTIAGTITAAAAAISAGLFCLKKCPPGKALIVVKNGQGSKEYRILREGQTLVVPGVEHAFLLDLAPFEILIANVMPPSVVTSKAPPLYLHASLRIAIANDDISLKRAARHFEGIEPDQITKMVSDHLSVQALTIEALPVDLAELGDPTVSGERLKAFWNKALADFGLESLKYEFTGITANPDALPHTPYGGEEAISQFCTFLDFQSRHEHFDIVIDNRQRLEDQLSLSWVLVAKVNPKPHNLTQAAVTFLGKDADDIKTMISDELTRIVDNALLTSGTYALLAHLEREATKIGLGKAMTTKQFFLRALNALAEQSLTWRGKLSFIRFVLSGLKVGEQLHGQFLRNIRARFAEWGLELEEVTLSNIDMKNTGRAAASDGTIEIAETEVCAYLEARWPIVVVETRTALVHANVCLRNEDKNNHLLPPINDELKSILTSSLESALNSNKWRTVFSSIENLMEEIGPEELERGNLRTDRALEELVDRIGATAFFLKLAKILLTGLEAYGEARKRFIAISGDELRKRKLVIGTFAIVNIDLDR
ncbi:MAG: hypothetical protein KGS72_08755 [Cyanobacteria bacterium REEB67]|nr:hypothetical protein [Cyanobacteria bacterium REEB67]